MYEFYFLSKNLNSVKSEGIFYLKINNSLLKINTYNNRFLIYYNFLQNFYKLFFS